MAFLLTILSWVPVSPILATKSVDAGLTRLQQGNFVLQPPAVRGRKRACPSHTVQQLECCRMLSDIGALIVLQIYLITRYLSKCRMCTMQVILTDVCAQRL